MGVPVYRSSTPQTEPSQAALSWYQAMIDALKTVPGGETLAGFLPQDTPEDLAMNLTGSMIAGPLAGPAVKGLSKVAGALRRIPNPIRAHHGSPHDFDAFDFSKIGTGEGAQAYGHGGYFAENPAVAKEYKLEMRGRYRDTTTGELVDSRDIADTTQIGKTGSDKRFQPVTGREYEVNIHATPDELLDWDKPLSQQSQKVRDSLQPLGFREGQATQTGEAIYDALQVPRRTSGNPVAASEALKQAGIPGIQYLDQGSRAAGEGTRNFVIFDDQLIEIARKYGVPLALAGEWVREQGGTVQSRGGDQ